MATWIVKVGGDGTENDWRAVGDSNRYQCVDEYPTPDDDTTYCNLTGGSGGIQRQTFTLLSSDLTSIPAVDLTSVTLKWRPQSSSASVTVKAACLLSSSWSYGASRNPTSYANYSEGMSRPGGGQWTKADLSSLEVGVEEISVPLFTSHRFTQLYLEIVTPDVHPTPTGLEIDRETNPSNASDDPLFSAIFQGTTESEIADEVSIDVSEVSNFATTVWASGWVSITNCADNVRCDEISYGGSVLSSDPPDGVYYVRLKFRDTAEKESAYATGTMGGFRRVWPAAVASYTQRQKLRFDDDHSAIPAGYVAEFELKTGLRQVVAENGHFDESVQASGGFQVFYRDGKTHYVYLSIYENTDSLGIYIHTLDHLTGEWGTPYKIIDAGTVFDTHHFPVIDLDEDGYIHIAYGCHYTAVRYVRSRYPNLSGSLPGEDDGSTLWLRPSQLPTITAGYDTLPSATLCSYPVIWHDPDSGRIFLWYRVGAFATSFNYSFHYSDDNGESWSDPCTFIADTYYVDNSNQRYRVYVYGLRYDLTTKRLHICWTHNHEVESVVDTERGIWYAYSDLDAFDELSRDDLSFNIFRWADGTVAGRTNGSGQTHTPIDFDQSRAVVWAPDYLSRVFVETLVLDADGSPIIFWEQKPFDHTPYHATYLIAATLSGSTWTIRHIYEQVDTMLRVRRSSIGVMTARDGTIHAWMPVNAKNWKHIKPTGDVDSVGVTRASEASNYLEVDDSVPFTQTAKYISLAGTTGVASFSHGGSIDSAYDILAVEVQATAEDTGLSAQVSLYISNGTTDDESANINLDDFAWATIENVWETNPFTSSAWAAADFATLEFGVKNKATYAVKFARVTLRVQVSLASHEDHAATEMYELTSSDNGATWSIREISRNTSNGCPIMNHKHHLTNDRIEIIYSNGHDIFYATDEPFGLVQRSAIDVRVFYAGSEIDRILDYANKDKSLIRFKVQAAIAAGRNYGPNDYEVFYGNKNEIGQPAANPHNVYLYFNNMEGYESGAQSSPFDDWTINSGTVYSYNTPPNHQNKVFAGERSLWFTAGAQVERTLGSGLANLWIEIAVWMEDSGTLFLDVEDSIGDTFGVGFKNNTNQAGYKIDNSWTWHATKKASYKMYYKMGLGITSAGGTVVFDRKRLVLEAASITSIDKLILDGSSETFWDFLAVMYRIAQATSHLYSTTNITPKQPALYDADNSNDYNVNDAMYHVKSSTAYKIDVRVGAIDSVDGGETVSIAVRLCKVQPWDPDFVIETQTDTIEIVSFGVEYYATITFDNIEPGTYSIKLDYYDYTGANKANCTTEIDRIIEYTVDGEPVVTLDTVERKGFYLDAVLLGGGRKAFQVDANLDGEFMTSRVGIPTAARETVQRQATAKLEISETNQYVKTLRAAWSGWSYIDSAMPTEFGLITSGLVVQSAVGIAQSVSVGPAAMSVEARCGRALQAIAFIETMIEFEQTFTFPVESLVRAVADLSQPVESLARLDYSPELPLEAGGVNIVGNFSLPLSYLTGTIAVNTGQVEHVLTVQQLPRALQIETVKSASFTRSFNAERLGTVQVSRELSVSVGALIDAISVALPSSFSGGLSSSLQLPIGSRAGIAFGPGLPVEFQGTVLLDAIHTLPVEAIAGMAAVVELPTEPLAGKSADLLAPLDFGYSILVRQALRTASRSSLASARSLLVETLGTSSGFVQGLRIETGAIQDATVSQLVVSSLLEKRAQIALNVGYRSGMTAFHELATAYGAYIPAITKAVQVEPGSGHAIHARAELAILAGMLAASSLPVENVGAGIVNIPALMPVEILSKVDQLSMLPLAPYRFTSATHKLQVSHNLTVQGIAQLTAGASHGVLAAAELIAGWTETTGATASMKIETIQERQITLATRIEFGESKQVMLSSLPIEETIKVLAALELPAEWLGVALVAIIMRNARLVVPSPENVDLVVPEASSPALAIARVINAEITGGTNEP